MNITVTAEKPGNDQVVATLTVAAADVDKAINKVYKDTAAKYNFQGFRRGRAPRPVIDSMVGREGILAEATDAVMNEAYPVALVELDIVPVGNPDFGGPVSVTEHEDLVVTCTINVAPTRELSSYDGVTINMPPAEATDAEVEQQLEQLMSYQTTYEENKRRSKVREDDVIVIDGLDIEGKSNVSSVKGEDRQIRLGAHLPADFVSAVAGMKKGEEKDVVWTEAHGDHEHEYGVKVVVKKIMEPVTPELDDEMAKKFGYDSVDALKDAVKEDIEQDKTTSLPGLKEDRVVIELGKQLADEELPEAYVNQVFNELAQETLSGLQRQGLTLDTALAMSGMSSDEFVNNLREQAADRARQSVALDALAKKLEFDASDDEVRAEFENAGVEDVDAAIADWTANGSLPAIREGIRRTKAVKWLVDNATVNIVDEVAERRAAEDAE